VINSQEKARIIAHAALDLQAEDVSIMDVRDLSTVTDYFVLCTAGSSRQMEAISDQVESAVRRMGGRVAHTEGSPGRQDDAANRWLLMDCADVVVHVLDGAARDFYQLDRLWGDAPRVMIGDAPPVVSRGRSAGS